MSKKITIFKEVYDYYYKGELTKEQFADLMLLHYQVMWGNGVEAEDIQDKEVRIIWRTLQHTVKKSAKNAKDYDKRKENAETENKANLSPLNDSDDKIYHPEIESVSNGLKTDKNEELKDNKEKDIEDMGNLLVFNQTTGKYEYPNKTKEEIKEKVIKNSLPTVQIAATAQTPSIPTFEEVLKDEKDAIENIIKDFNAGGMNARVQAPENLKDLLNRKWGRYYKEQITEYINNRRVA